VAWGRVCLFFRSDRTLLPYRMASQPKPQQSDHFHWARFVSVVSIKNSHHILYKCYWITASPSHILHKKLWDLRSLLQWAWRNTIFWDMNPCSLLEICFLVHSSQYFTFHCPAKSLKFQELYNIPIGLMGVKFKSHIQTEEQQIGIEN
jgi:hypothetical protein